MRVAITGASGLLGRRLAASLAADGHEPVPVVRPSNPAAAGAGGDVVRRDPAAGEIGTEALARVDLEPALRALLAR